MLGQKLKASALSLGNRLLNQRLFLGGEGGGGVGISPQEPCILVNMEQSCFSVPMYQGRPLSLQPLVRSRPEMDVQGILFHILST